VGSSLRIKRQKGENQGEMKFRQLGESAVGVGKKAKLRTIGSGESSQDPSEMR